ncbi:MAG: hypothetical protein KY444_02500 [Gemmatimonadetes bacterium]|nr:hypothetical protein [Gemmatimonadota bacterium]
MTSLARLVALAALPLLAVCAAREPGTRRPANAEVQLEVRNDLVPPRGVTVRAVSAAGARTLLGAVSAGQTARLEYEQPGFQGQYYFLAEVDGGATVRSTRINLADGARLVWSLQNNTLREVD